MHVLRVNSVWCLSVWAKFSNCFWAIFVKAIYFKSSTQVDCWLQWNIINCQIRISSEALTGQELSFTFSLHNERIFLKICIHVYCQLQCNVHVLSRQYLFKGRGHSFAFWIRTSCVPKLLYWNFVNGNAVFMYF